MFKKWMAKRGEKFAQEMHGFEAGEASAVGALVYLYEGPLAGNGRSTSAKVTDGVLKAMRMANITRRAVLDSRPANVFCAGSDRGRFSMVVTRTDDGIVARTWDGDGSYLDPYISCEATDAVDMVDASDAFPGSPDLPTKVPSLPVGPGRKSNYELVQIRATGAEPVLIWMHGDDKVRFRDWLAERVS